MEELQRGDDEDASDDGWKGIRLHVNPSAMHIQHEMQLSSPIFAFVLRSASRSSCRHVVCAFVGRQASSPSAPMFFSIWQHTKGINSIMLWPLRV